MTTSCADLHLKSVLRDSFLSLILPVTPTAHTFMKNIDVSYTHNHFKLSFMRPSPILHHPVATMVTVEKKKIFGEPVVSDIILYYT